MKEEMEFICTSPAVLVLSNIPLALLSELCSLQDEWDLGITHHMHALPPIQYQHQENGAARAVVHMWSKKQVDRVRMDMVHVPDTLELSKAMEEADGLVDLLSHPLDTDTQLASSAAAALREVKGNHALAAVEVYTHGGDRLCVSSYFPGTCMEKYPQQLLRWGWARCVVALQKLHGMHPVRTQLVTAGEGEFASTSTTVFDILSAFSHSLPGCTPSAADEEWRVALYKYWVVPLRMQDVDVEMLMPEDDMLLVPEDFEYTFVP